MIYCRRRQQKSAAAGRRDLFSCSARPININNKSRDSSSEQHRGGAASSRMFKTLIKFRVCECVSLNFCSSAIQWLHLAGVFPSAPLADRFYSPILAALLSLTLLPHPRRPCTHPADGVSASCSLTSPPAQILAQAACMPGRAWRKLRSNYARMCRHTEILLCLHLAVMTLTTALSRSLDAKSKYK